MNKIIVLLIACLSCSAYAQEHSFSVLLRASQLSDSVQRKQSLDQLWNSMQQQGHIPLITGDSVVFLYRGQARSVQWMGDFNGWGYDKKFNTHGKRLGKTNLWYLKAAFPKNARLDYKILLNDKNWILDPENPHQQWSGVGGGSPNSELRMPAWKEDEWLTEKVATPHGKIITDLLLTSTVLGYQINYSVYLPSVHDPSARLPVIYVTDGYEYMHPKMGNMTTIMDNLIAAKKIRPAIAVFVDHREPVDRTNNKRMEELAMNTKYLRFFTDELIPLIEATYPAKADAANRMIMGTSMGGLNAAYFVFAKPELFGMAGIQSPAFYTRPQIYSLCNNPGNTRIKISMTSGLINDTSEGGQKMKTLLETNACEYHYREVNEGHSWGNWRNLIDDILIDLLGPP